MIGIINYGSGNLNAFVNVFKSLEKKIVIIDNPDDLKNCSHILMPGVSAWDTTMQSVNRFKDTLSECVFNKKLPFLGVCVGMQILFADSQEGAPADKRAGIGIWPNQVVKLSNPILPHMGWNTVSAGSDSVLFNGLDQEQFYFVHSYAVVESAGKIASWSDYDQKFLAAVEDGSIVATQFHPEKSGKAGLKLISNWVASL